MSDRDKAGRPDGPNNTDKVVRTDAEWRRKLTPEQLRVLREKGTERAFTGAYWSHKAEGCYRCAGCGMPLFTSDTKYESRSGWPSFWQPIDPGRLREEKDRSLGMQRVEVLCGRCDSHLGHVFPDGPEPTGMRYCINSAALDFADKTDSTEEPEPE